MLGSKGILIPMIKQAHKNCNPQKLPKPFIIGVKAPLPKRTTCFPTKTKSFPWKPKPGRVVHAQSLKVFCQKYNPKMAIRICHHILWVFRITRQPLAPKRGGLFFYSTVNPPKSTAPAPV